MTRFEKKAQARGVLKVLATLAVNDTAFGRGIRKQAGIGENIKSGYRRLLEMARGDMDPATKKWIEYLDSSKKRYEDYIKAHEQSTDPFLRSMLPSRQMIKHKEEQKERALVEEDIRKFKGQLAAYGSTAGVGALLGGGIGTGIGALAGRRGRKGRAMGLGAGIGAGTGALAAPLALYIAQRIDAKRSR